MYAIAFDMDIEALRANYGDPYNNAYLDIRRVLQTKFQIDDFQDSYFVIDDFEQLFAATERTDFAPIYAELKGKPEFEAGVVADGDAVLHLGTGEYAAEAKKRRATKKSDGNLPA